MSFSISKGPYRFSASFFIGWKGVMFVPSSHTLVPFLRGGRSDQ